MSTLTVFFILLAISFVLLTAYALYKKEYVKASVSLRPFGFFIEAGSTQQTNQKMDVQGTTKT